MVMMKLLGPQVLTRRTPLPPDVSQAQESPLLVSSACVCAKQEEKTRVSGRVLAAGNPRRTPQRLERGATMTTLTTTRTT